MDARASGAVSIDFASMLRELADRGWRPVLYHDDGTTQAKNPAPETLAAPWVAYGMAGEIRHWRSFRAADPVAAIRALYAHAIEHPNVPPMPPPAPPATSPAPEPPKAAVSTTQLEPVEPIAYTASAHVSPSIAPRTARALCELAAAAAAALRGGLVGTAGGTR